MGASFIVALVIALLVGLGMAVLFGLQIGREEKKLFEREIRQRVRNFLKRNEMKPEEFVVIAKDTLKKGSSLLKFLDDILV